MRLTRVRAQNWRGLADRTVDFAPGLNVLCGDNERGKSSFVDAIQKALSWDHTQRKTANDRLESIPPAGAPTARPTVSVEFELGSRRVIVTKVVASEKSKRECTLEVVESGRPTQSLRGEQAEKRLAELLGVFRDAGALVASGQGNASAVMRDSLPPSIAGAVSIDDRGGLSLGERLEAVRLAVREDKLSHLGKKEPKDPIRDCIVKQSDHSELRDEWASVAAALTAARQSLASVEELRRQIESRRREIAALAPQVERSDELLSARRRLRDRQMSALREKAQSEQVRSDRKRTLENLERQAEERSRLGAELTRLEEERVRINEELNAARRRVDDTRRRRREAGDRQNASRARWDDSRKRVEAIHARRELIDRLAEREQCQKSLAKLASLEAEATAAQARLAALGAWPRDAQIGQWRADFRDLDALRRDAAGKLSLTLRLEKPARLTWLADQQPRPAIDVGSDEAAEITAVRRITVSIEGVGSIEVYCGAEELSKILDAMVERETSLTEKLSIFGVTASDLPDGFDRLEQRRIEGQAAEQAAALARTAWIEAETGIGGKAAATRLLQEAESAVAAATARLAPLKELIPAGVDGAALGEFFDQESRRARDLEDEARAAELALASIAEEHQEADTLLTQLSTRLTDNGNRIGEIRNRLALFAPTAVAADAASELSQARVALAVAEAAVVDANERLTELGPTVEESEVNGLEASLHSSRERLHEMDRAMSDLRGQLRTLCDRDPAGQVAELEERVGELEPRVHGVETELAGLALLEAALEHRRRRLAQELARPIDDLLSPWLTRIRGVPTHALFDPEQARITGIEETSPDGARRYFAFDDLSEGMKQQLALVARVMLTVALARKSGRGLLLILDDPLTETSPSRRPDLFQVLARAADDLQILFVTCHQDTLTTIPGAVNVIPF